MDDQSGPSPGAVQLADGWNAVARSHLGLVRTRNEDQFILVPQLGLCAVADGLGGAPAGDVASQLACDALVSAIHGADGNAPTREILAMAFATADQAVHAHGQADPRLSGMGTTLSALWFRDPEVPGGAHYAHVGDSRIYVLRPSGLEQITQDDTAGMDLVRQGRMTLAEAEKSVYWHFLTQSIGGYSQVPQIGEVDPDGASAILLCSDGLTGMVDDAKIEAILGGPSKDPASALIEAALRNGGRDNVTVVVLSRSD